ncbi:hypothetical protein AYK20_04650 [Thermoplasmatales archaeon SG8-52-1]|nr:MAG: hypothetical protein AYK20_04650 [Thermoplasmatales archaeon SG8-52-1]
MENTKKQKIFDEKGKLKAVKKKNKKELVKEKLKKEITAEQFLEQLKFQLKVESKWDKYEHVIRTGNKVCAWVCERQNFVSMSIFPPFNDAWKTIRIKNQVDADNAIIMLKAKINGYKK